MNGHPTPAAALAKLIQCKTDTLQCKTDTSSKHITFIVEQVPGMHPVHVSGILNLPENLLPLSIQNENVAS